MEWGFRGSPPLSNSEEEIEALRVSPPHVTPSSFPLLFRKCPQRIPLLEPRGRREGGGAAPPIQNVSRCFAPRNGR